jgi:hypothetical protein
MRNVQKTVNSFELLFFLTFNSHTTRKLILEKFIKMFNSLRVYFFLIYHAFMFFESTISFIRWLLLLFFFYCIFSCNETPYSWEKGEGEE